MPKGWNNARLFPAAKMKRNKKLVSDHVLAYNSAYKPIFYLPDSGRIMSMESLALAPREGQDQQDPQDALRAMLAADGQNCGWLDGLSVRAQKQGLVVGFIHAYFASWFSRHKKDLFERAVERLYPEATPRLFYLWPHHASGDAAGRNRRREEAKLRVAAKGAAHGKSEDPFAAFFAGSKNAFALREAKKAVEAGARGCEFMLLLGPSGVGKSHLLSSMCRTMARQSGESPLYLAAAAFCRRESADPHDFWAGERALILDDLQDVCGHEDWQARICAFMDEAARYGGKKRMFFAHLGQRASLGRLCDRLRTRLESGMVLELSEPDLEARLEFVRNWAHAREDSLERQCLLYLARQSGNFRGLTGILRRVEAQFGGKRPALDDLRRLLEAGGAQPGLLDIIGLVCRAFNLEQADVLGQKRKSELVLARQLAMYLCRKKIGLSYPELGKAFGRDHSTVIHSIRKIEVLSETDQVMHKKVSELENTAIFPGQ